MNICVAVSQPNFVCVIDSLAVFLYVSQPNKAIPSIKEEEKTQHNNHTYYTQHKNKK